MIFLIDLRSNQYSADVFEVFLRPALAMEDDLVNLRRPAGRGIGNIPIKTFFVGDGEKTG
jgi:hypothetical protein